MRHIFFSTICFLLSSCYCCNNKKGATMEKTEKLSELSEIEEKLFDECSISKVDIFFVDIDIDTAIRVECSDFPNHFETFKKKKTILDKRILYQFELALKDFSPDSEIDTRIQLIVNKKDTNVDTICIDRFTLTENLELCKILEDIKVVKPCSPEVVNKK